MCIIKRRLKFENYKNCLEAGKLKNKSNYIEKIRLPQTVFIRQNKNLYNKSILKTQPRFKSRRRNVFAEEINKIALISNDNKRMQSIDLIENDGYGTSKYILNDKKEIKCYHIIKRYRK